MYIATYLWSILQQNSWKIPQLLYKLSTDALPTFCSYLAMVLWKAHAWMSTCTLCGKSIIMANSQDSVNLRACDLYPIRTLYIENNVLYLDSALVLYALVGTCERGTSEVPPIDRWDSSPMKPANVCCTFATHRTNKAGSLSCTQWEAEVLALQDKYFPYTYIVPLKNL